MKKLLLSLLTILITTNSYAEWKFYDTSKTGGKHYYDNSSIRRHGDKVKVTLLMKGREKAHPERGELVILKFTESLSQVGSPESLPKYENGKWIIMLKPKKK